MRSNKYYIAKKISLRVLIYAILTIGAAFSLIPLLWLVRSSLMETAQIFEIPLRWLPDPICWDNFEQALTVVPFVKYFRNSAIIVIGVVAGTVFTSSITAFAFSRLEWKGRDMIFGILLSGMMLPFAVTLIPTFVMWSKTGLTNTFIPLILPSWFGGGAGNIFMLRQFYSSIPKELDEAAIIDGASTFRIYS